MMLMLQKGLDPWFPQQGSLVYSVFGNTFIFLEYKLILVYRIFFIPIIFINTTIFVSANSSKFSNSF